MHARRSPLSRDRMSRGVVNAFMPAFAAPCSTSAESGFTASGSNG
jgi:hypothetical protein